MNDRLTLIATGFLVAFFFIGGILELLDNFFIKMVLFLAFIGIVVNIIMIKSKDDDKKNLP